MIGCTMGCALGEETPLSPHFYKEVKREQGVPIQFCKWQLKSLSSHIEKKDVTGKRNIPLSKSGTQGSVHPCPGIS